MKNRKNTHSKLFPQKQCCLLAEVSYTTYICTFPSVLSKLGWCSVFSYSATGKTFLSCFASDQHTISLFYALQSLQAPFHRPCTSICPVLVTSILYLYKSIGLLSSPRRKPETKPSQYHSSKYLLSLT
jgi:hypothetical protein